MSVRLTRLAVALFAQRNAWRASCAIELSVCERLPIRTLVTNGRRRRAVGADHAITVVDKNISGASTAITHAAVRVEIGPYGKTIRISASSVVEPHQVSANNGNVWGAIGREGAKGLSDEVSRMDACSEARKPGQGRAARGLDFSIQRPGVAVAIMGRLYSKAMARTRTIRAF